MPNCYRVYRAIHQALIKALGFEVKGNQARHLNVLVGFICGIIQSKDVRLSEVAGEIPKSGQEDSHVMQLRRWLKNESVDAELYYLPYIKQILKALAHQTLVLIIDGSTTGRGCMTLMISVYYKGQAIPVLWVTRKAKKGHFPETMHIELIRLLKALIPKGADVVCLGDGEFDGAEWLNTIKSFGWHYACRSSIDSALLDLLGLRDAQPSVQLASQNSSLDAWRQEAHKLELQGKQEQAERIRSEILKQKTPDWIVISPTTLPGLKQNAIEEKNKNALMTLFEYALVYEDRDILNGLLKTDFKAAKHPDKGLQLLQQKHYSAYSFKKPDAVLKQVDQYGADFRNIFNQTPLMVATWMGNTEVIKALFELGADTEKVDNNGLTALQIALAQTDRSESYAKKKLNDIYALLEPTSMSIQVDGRLVKLDKNSMEFFLLNLMIALFYRVMPQKLTWRVEGFSTQDFLAAIAHIPHGILPERRKQRAYLSAILSKNEVDKDDRYNRKLFYRVMRGAYILNPTLAIKVENEWVNIYDLLSIDRLAPQYRAKEDWWHQDYNERIEQGMAKNKALLKQLITERQDVGR